VDVPEDAPIGTTIARLHATDNDTGENAHVRYAFSTRSAANYGNLFAIDRETGNVVLLQSLSYSPGDEEVEYHLSVVAEDAGPYPFPALASLRVRVIDVNSHSPRITVDTMGGASSHADDDVITGGTGQPEVEENRPAGTFVAHVTVTDADSGRNGVVSCKLSGMQRLFVVIVIGPTGCSRKKWTPKYFAVFSTIIWDFNMKFFSFIY